ASRARGSDRNPRRWASEKGRLRARDRSARAVTPRLPLRARGPRPTWGSCRCHSPTDGRSSPAPTPPDPGRSACTCQIHDSPFEVEVQPQRELPFAVDLEASAVAPAGAALILRACGVGEHLPRHHRVWVLVPFGVNRAVARYRLSRRLD